MLNPKAKLASNILDKMKVVMKPTRDGYGEGLIKAGEENTNIVVLCADLTESTRSLMFQQKFPERFVEVGVAEQNMASLAAGFALAGKIPFISSYAMFSPGRNWEQIRTTIAYNEVNVKIAGAHAGISVGPDGATHQALEDIAIMRVMPNVKVLVPCDAIEAKKATYEASKIQGPVYLRFAREKTATFTTEDTPFTFGKAEIFREGKDVAIIGCGPVIYNALLAAEELSKEIDCKVINCHTVKPLDHDTILDAARETSAIVTVEEHQVAGGLGSAVCEFLAENYSVAIERIGVRDSFGESGAPEELIEKFGMGVDSIKQAIKKVFERKLR